MMTTNEVAKWDVLTKSGLVKKKKRFTLQVNNIDGSVKLTIQEPALSDAKRFMKNIIDSNNHDHHNVDKWEIEKSIPIDAIHISQQDEDVVYVKAPWKSRVKTKDVTFNSKDDAFSFVTFINKFKLRLHEKQEEDDDDDEELVVVPSQSSEPEKFLRSQVTTVTQEVPSPTNRVSSSPTKVDLMKVHNDEMTLLIEIVSARELAGSNFSTLKADPYVQVKLNGTEIYKSKRIDNDMNPVWTVLTGSLFLFRVTKLNKDKDLTFFINDFNALRKDNNLGYTPVSIAALANDNSERLSFSLLPPTTAARLGSGVKVRNKFKRFSAYGTFTVRSRIATESDIDFMRKLKQRGGGFNDTICDIEDMVIAQSNEAKKKLFGTYKKNDHHGKIKYLVRPCPDFRRPDETKWLTKTQLEKEALSPSYSWLDIGSGTLAKVYLEIIGCDGLRDTDKNVLDKDDKTDACCCIVYEDTIVCTETVNDCLSPRWMPWTQRAFVLHTESVYARLRIGVFDKDKGLKEQFGGHDYLGRIDINLANCETETEYILKYNLRGEGEEQTLSRFGEKTKSGTITIRLHLECSDPRALLMSALSIPEKMFVNVESPKQYTLARNIVHGVHNETSYNLGNMMSSYMELMEYQTVLSYLMEGFYAVFLWRGHYGLDVYLPCKSDSNSEDAKWKFDCFKKNKIYLPLYSMVLFVGGVTLVESPTLCIPYFFGTIACIMLALQSLRNNNPSPWVATKTFDDYLSVLLYGKQLSIQKKVDIKPNENKEEAALYRKELEDRLLKEAEEREEQFLEYTKAQEEQTKFVAEVTSLERKSIIHSKEAVLLAPFKAIIYPYQMMLVNIVYALRYTSSIFSWENSYISFWITLISFVLFLVCLVIPWAFILTWSMRIIVWTLLGPWMKFADIYYYKPLEELSEEAQAMEKQKRSNLRHEVYDKTLTNYKIVQEEALKLRDIKKCMYGPHIVAVPHFHIQKYTDTPLPESYARSIDKKSVLNGTKPFRVPGQHLVGTMIPMPVNEVMAIEAKKMEEEKKNAPKASSFLKNFLSRSSDESELTVPLKKADEVEGVKSYGGTD